MIWCVLVCVLVFAWACVLTHACRFLQQTEEENQSFSRRHPIHDTFSCEFGVDTAAHIQLRQEGVCFFSFLFFFPDPSPLTVINTNRQTKSCCHIFPLGVLQEQSQASPECWHALQQKKCSHVLFLFFCFLYLPALVGSS